MQFLTVSHNGTGLKFEIILGFPEINKKVRNMGREKEKNGDCLGRRVAESGPRDVCLAARSRKCSP